MSFSGGSATFSQLANDANALAAGLEGLGLKSGDVVSYQLPNWYETAVLFLAIMRVGAIANPIVPIYRKKEVSFIVQEAGAKFLFVPETYRGFDHLTLALELNITGLTVVTCRGAGPEADYRDLLSRQPGKAPKGAPSGSEEEAAIIYTSGTTANPKGVRHSQRTLMAGALTLLRTGELTEWDVGYVVTPLTHVAGLVYGCLMPQLVGTRACLVDAWDAREAVKLIEQERCTTSFGATPILRGILEAASETGRDISSIRFARCGGSDVPPGLIKDARERGIDSFRSYGSSEMMTISGRIKDPANKGIDTDGRIHDDIFARVAALDDDLKALPDGLVGEIQIKSDRMFLGYKDVALDADSFTSDGWFKTGDLGSTDGEGFITIAGRRKDIIVRKGENISAKEVEDALYHHPLIKQIAVVGLPDDERGEIVTAVCVPKPGEKPTVADLRAHLDSVGIARQKYPERIELIDTMPMTPSGKIQKAVLKAKFAVQSSTRP
jgi:cyclohexanecarboxylate-CoA ligase